MRLACSNAPAASSDSPLAFRLSMSRRSSSQLMACLPSRRNLRPIRNHPNARDHPEHVVQVGKRVVGEPGLVQDLDLLLALDVAPRYLAVAGQETDTAAIG